jgi:hypothetical protein
VIFVIAENCWEDCRLRNDLLEMTNLQIGINDLDYPEPVVCEERKRLERLYLDAVRKNAVAGAHLLNTKSEAWQEATKDTRAACDVALANLNRHREEHGC